jgi:hypothetical protein
MVPEIYNLEEPLQADFEWYSKDKSTFTAYNLYEDILCPYCISLIKKEDNHSLEIVKRIMILIESLIKHQDFQVQCLAKVGFLEKLVHDLSPRKDLEKYLLHKSLEAARIIAKKMYGLNPYTWAPD